MTRETEEELSVVIRVDDVRLAARLAEILGGAPGLRVVGSGTPADLVLETAESEELGLGLTPRERQVIALLAEGLSNKGIAKRLSISPDTAKFHVGRLLDKLDATGRTDAVAHAARLGILDL